MSRALIGGVATGDRFCKGGLHMANTKAKGERITDSAQRSERIPMTVKQLSEYSGWSEKTIYNKVFHHTLPYYKSQGARRVLFDKAEIDAILFGNRIASTCEVKERAVAIAREVAV